MHKIKKEIGKIEKLGKRITFECLYPKCSKKSIASHSQQRGGQLKEISKNDEVYTMNFNMFEALTQSASAFSLVKTRIRNASTYPGFCQNHDGPVFAAIENKPLVHNDNLQAATLFLRAITYELTRKKVAHFKTEKVIANCSKLLHKDVIREFEIQNLGREKFMKNDSKFYLSKAYDACRVPTAGIIRTKWKVIDKVINASSCTVFSPMRNIKERFIHQATASPQVMTTFNLIPTKDVTHVVVSWLSEHMDDNDWIDTEMDNNLEKFVNYVAICESEDICIGPDLWESIDVFTQDRVQKNMLHEVYRGSIDEIPRVIKI